jgi:anti-sigma B factor antagonist
MPPPVSVPAHELLTIRVTVAPSAVVTAAGEVDSCSAPLLAAALQAAADQARAGTEILADLSAVTFLDSAGVHVLADAHRRVTAAGGRLTVLAVGQAVRRPLQLTGLAGALGVEPDAAHPTISA